MQKYPIQHIHQGIDDIPDELAWNENHKIVKIGDSWFSFTAKGNSIQFHLFGANPRTLSDACTTFIGWLFLTHDWCTMLLVTVNKKSLFNLAIKHYFCVIDRNGDSVFLARKR